MIKISERVRSLERKRNVTNDVLIAIADLKTLTIHADGLPQVYSNISSWEKGIEELKKNNPDMVLIIEDIPE